MTGCIDQQPAFVLHRRPYRNTSLLLDLLSPDYGRIALVARGVRGPRSRLAALLQPFVPLRVSWAGKTDLLRLYSAEEDGLPIPLPAARLLSGLYLNELLLKLLPRADAQPALFVLYARTLHALASAPEQESVLRVFEKQLLDELGYGLSLAHSADGKTVLPELAYRYVLEHGPVMAATTEAGIPISGAALLALHQENLSDPSHRQTIKQLTRAAIAQLLHGRALQSRQLLTALQRRSGTGQA